ncbi:MAG TPA: hypothetical protein VMV07_12835 [Streptosporangiaceae bacterium]|nr:hypothetical protein [Streptosporangiaceae bacterium]
MRAIRRLCLAPLVGAAAILVIAAPSHLGTGATHHGVMLADPICPSGTNWDNLLGTCR